MPPLVVGISGNALLTATRSCTHCLPPGGRNSGNIKRSMCHIARPKHLVYHGFFKNISRTRNKKDSFPRGYGPGNISLWAQRTAMLWYYYNNKNIYTLIQAVVCKYRNYHNLGLAIPRQSKTEFNIVA